MEKLEIDQATGQEIRNGYRSEEEIEYGSDYPQEYGMEVQTH